MYNVIFSMIDIRWTLTETQEQEFKKKFDFVRPLPESRTVTNWHTRIMYQANITTMNELEKVKIQLQQLDDPRIIGVWNRNTWIQQWYTRPVIQTEEWVTLWDIERETEYNEELWWNINVNIDYPFDFNEYWNYLSDIVEYDQDGNELSRRRPTEEEAKNTQVNRFAWMPDRDLNVYNF